MIRDMLLFVWNSGTRKLLLLIVSGRWAGFIVGSNYAKLPVSTEFKERKKHAPRLM